MKLIIANWKNNPATRDEAIALARAEDIKGLVIAPSEKFMSDVARVLEHATLGAQDYGEKLTSFGAKYVIVGHSDRRAKGETDAIVAEKMKLVLEQEMTPILCVGESFADHAAGRAKAVVREQLRLDLNSILHSQYSILPVIVAYEPIWAISTNPNAIPDTPENASNMIHLIHEELRVVLSKWETRVLYGGSVDERNVESFLTQKEIDGCLVGGASLHPEAMKKIMNIVAKLE